MTHAFRRLLLLAFLLPLALASQAQKFKSAVDYNDHIVELQNSIGREIISFNELMALETTTRETLEKPYQHMLQTTRDALADVKSMPAWEGETELRDAAAALFGFYLDIFSNDYPEMLDIAYADAPTEADFARLDEVMTSVGEREGAFDARFSAAQNAFATRYGFILEHNELQEEIDSQGDEE